MASYVISTSCDLSNWGLAIGDDITISNGATVTISTSINATLTGIVVKDKSTLQIMGGTAPYPINIALANAATPAFQLEGGCTLTSTLGWKTLGTGDGTANQLIDFKSMWGGERTTGTKYADRPFNIQGVWVETGRLINFVGGTHYEAPRDGDLLRVVTDRDVIYGPIETYNAGVNGTGSFILKYLSGGTNILDAKALEVCKVVDNQGPYYDVTFQGTSVGTDTLYSGVFSPFVNVTDASTNTTGALSMGGTDFNGFLFTNDITSTQGTFGNGTNGCLLPVGAIVKAPMIHIGYANNGVTPKVFYRNNQSVTMTPGAGGATWDYNGASLTNIGYTWANGAKEFNFNYFTSDRVPTNSQSTINDYKITNSIFPFLLDTNWTLGAPIGGSCCFSNNLLYGANKSLAWTCPAANGMSLTNNIFSSSNKVWKQQNITGQLTHLKINRNSIGACYFSITDCANIEFNENILKSCSTSGTGGVLSGNSFITYTRSRGDCIIKGLVSIQLTQQSGAIVTQTNPYGINSFKVRALGSYQYPLTMTAQGQGFLSLTGYAKGFDLSRMYFSECKQWTPDRTMPSLTGGIVGFDASEIRNFQGYTQDTAYSLAGKNGRARGLSAGTAASISSNNAPIRTLSINSVGYCFSDALAGTSAGEIFCQFASPTTTANEYTSGTIVQRLATSDGISGFLPLNETVIVEQSYYAKGHSSLTGVCTYNDIATTIGGTDWLGNVGTYFQYDRLAWGTGFNGTWLPTTNPANWTNIPDIADGVKLKFKIEGTTAGTNVTGLCVHTNATLGTMHRKEYLIPIDQSTTVITLQNVVVGSRYWIYNNDLSTLITSGVAAGSIVTYNATNLADGTTLKIRVRYASTGTKYLPFETNTITSSLTASAYISQVVDTIVT